MSAVKCYIRMSGEMMVSDSSANGRASYPLNPHGIHVGRSCEDDSRFPQTALR